jgi:HD-like signal output (HDOD) protein
MVNQKVLEKILDQVNTIPPLPQIAYKTLALLRNPESTMQDIAALISLDQVMTRNVLGWANSAQYGLPRTVNTVHQAIMYLGQITVRSIVLTACVSGVLNRELPGYGLERGDLWRHSVGVAIGARLLASKTSKAAAEEAYFAGLLCDIGKLGFEVVLRNKNMDTDEFQDKPFEQVETEMFGINHAALGKVIAQKWMLPDPICQTIFFHHQPSLAKKEEKIIASAVHVADLAAMMIGIGLGGDGLRYTPDPLSFEVLNIKENDMPAILDQVSNYVNDVSDLFGVDKP